MNNCAKCGGTGWINEEVTRYEACDQGHYGVAYTENVTRSCDECHQPVTQYDEPTIDFPFSNGLSEAEAERLAMLLEELGEVQQIIGKILRHGYESRDPTKDDSPTNRALLERELGDVSAIVELMSGHIYTAAKDLKPSKIEAAAEKRIQKILKKKYTHHQ